MTKLLFIKASPRGDDSKSTAVANAYLAKLQAQDAQLEVDVLDLSAETLPDFDGNKVAAKMNIITGQDQDASQRTAWDEITTMAHRFISADIYLIASPMWNGSIPYKFKQYIDLVHQPGLLWGLDPEKGYFGLLEGKKAVLALTSGAYGPNMPSPAFGVDHQSAYLKFWLNQAGVENIEEIRFQPTLLTADPEAGFQAAVAEAEKLVS
ncbi:NAD(P)H-dependent oxidoreductase [Leisingera sp. MMG026]|uniref:FMN-dependent NADH-azoreductase n=1 Tax=Leisingera sp. MMG026 TaxID=2909982 RepID=UPI001F2766F0|nr:NAD(P)H-dependent oxidoreductase [Leisingera sp. MMG026]MCF6432462.1 NAD(P)H-dependent oxidoreductase [Leisingera sp. MMG026]